MKLLNKIIPLHFPFRPKTADIIGQPHFTILGKGARVALKNVNFDLNLPPNSKGTIFNMLGDTAFVNWDDKPYMGALAVNIRELQFLPEEKTAAEVQPAVQPTANAPQQKLIANSMGDFANMVAPNQVWQSQSGNFLHLQPNFAVTARDNNRIVMSGIQWRTADNQRLTPSQPNTLISSDFPFTLRKDLMAVTGELKFADVIGLPDFYEEDESNHGVVTVLRDDIEWQLTGKNALDYDLVNDQVSLDYIAQLLGQGYVAGDLYVEEEGEHIIRGRGWWKKIASLNTTSARPIHQGEYTWEQFKHIARAGQIWQTSNSLIRIDRLLENAPTRRQSRFIRFKGAWTGTGPRSLRALLPQKNGKFLNSTSPWLVSRMYEPFLLIREGVFEGLSEGVDTSMPPTEDNAQPEASTPMSGKPQEYPELELEGGDSQIGQEHRHDVYASTMCPECHISMGYPLAIGDKYIYTCKKCGKKVEKSRENKSTGRPKQLRTNPYEDERIGSLRFSYVGRTLERKFIDSLAPDFEEYPYPYGKPVTKRRGRPPKRTDKSHRVEALEDIVIPTQGVIPKGTTGAAVKDEGDSVYVIWNDGSESFGIVEKNKIKYVIPRPEPEMELVGSLKFSDIISQPSQIDVAKTQANTAYQNIASFLQNGHFHEVDGQLAFNVKYYRVDIPDNVRLAISADNMNSIIQQNTATTLYDFVLSLKETYPWIEGYEITGRSGGWLQLVINESKFGLPYAEIIWETLWQREPDLNSTAELLVEQGEEPEFKIWNGLAYAAEAMDKAFNEIDTKVDEAKAAFIKQLESQEFWAEYM